MLSITTNDIALSSETSAGLTFGANATVYNPSIINSTMGSMGLEMQYQGVDLGVLSCANLFLQQGYNNMSCEGTIPISNGSISNSFISAILTGTVTIQLTGTTTSLNGSEAPDWLIGEVKGIQSTLKVGPLVYSPRIPLILRNSTPAMAVAFRQAVTKQVAARLLVYFKETSN
jgi:hypothetical protein